MRAGKQRPAGKLIEALLWALLAFLAADVFRAAAHPPLENDSYQFLSVAQNIRTGHGIRTALIFFDVERSHGQMPAPLTTFPPLYPLAIAALGHFAANLELAGRLVSMLSFALTAALLAIGLIQLRAAPLVRIFILILFLANATLLGFATSILSEPLFTLLIVGVADGLFWIEAELACGRFRPLPSACILSLAGLACWVRYAGYFIVLALAVYLCAGFLLRPSRPRLMLAALYLLPIGIALALAARNLRIAGNWRGGNDLVVHHSLQSVLWIYCAGHYHLFLGNHALSLGYGEGTVIAALIALSVLATIVFTAPAPADAPAPALRRQTLLPVLLVLIYTAAMIWAGLHSDITFGGRMFLPMLPFYLLLFAVFIGALDRRIAFRPMRAALLTVLVLLGLGVIAANARDLAMAPQPAPDQIVSADFAAPTASGQPLTQWLRNHTTADEVLLAEDGQATGFALGHPTVALVDSEYSRITWDCATVAATLARFHARYVVLYRAASAAAISHHSAHPNTVLRAESPFVAAALDGTIPCGFAIAQENAAVRILRAPRP